MKSSVVVGLGRSGLGAAKLLHAQGHQVTVLESNANDSAKAAALRDLGINVRLGCPLDPDPFASWTGPLDQVVISPGIAWDHPTLGSLRQKGIAVCGEMAVAWDALCHHPWIGITGTNGKTTVTHLLQHVLSHAGLQAPIAGNVGHSAAELALDCHIGAHPQPDWIVMELSSYQIEAAAQVAPRIGIWTTLTPDHLERHGTLAAYRAIKRGLLARSEQAVLNADDPDLCHHHHQWPDATWVSTSATPPVPCTLWIDREHWVRNRQQRLFPANALPLPGNHNRQNMLLVTAAALQAGLASSTIAAALRCFPGVPHRLEPLGIVKGMRVYNDSKATNYAAAAVGLRAVEAPVIVLAGGQTKQGDASEWLGLLHERAAAVVLFGHGADELEALIANSSFDGPVANVDTLDAAVREALALTCNQAAHSLLLSPACASFDHYSNFEARGEHFCQLIRAIQSKG
ncbi:MAG: UDP-N-acetylmuramoyl-L-alanine--D-glutamate ligase [Synechococcus sp.]